MSISTWILYIFLASLNIITPGPAVFLSISNAISYGIRSSIISSIGNILGIFCLSSAVIAGIISIFMVYPYSFFILKILGAAYLIYIGFRKFRSIDDIFNNPVLRKSKNFPKSHQLFLSGFLLAITNPKPILFFGAIYPQFISTMQPLIPQFFILTVTFMIISFISLLTYAMVSLKAKSWLSKNSRAICFNQITGGTFIILGCSMLTLKNN